MINIGGFSLRSLVVGVRFVRRYKNFPHLLADWTPEQNTYLQDLCKLIDIRYYKS